MKYFEEKAKALAALEAEDAYQKSIEAAYMQAIHDVLSALKSATDQKIIGLRTAYYYLQGLEPKPKKSR